jgi:hypothetical protein
VSRLGVLRLVAVLIGLRACMNFGKPFGTGSGLVFLGTLLTGTPMLILAPLLGLYMIVWAWTLWHLQAAALWLGLPYLAFVVVNIVRFPIATGLPAYATLPMYAVYGLVAIGAPALALWLVASLRREGR